MTLRYSAAVMALVCFFPLSTFSNEPTSSFLFDDVELEEIFSDIPQNLTLKAITLEQLAALPYITRLQASEFLSLRDSLSSELNLFNRLSDDARFSDLQIRILSQIPYTKPSRQLQLTTRTGTITPSSCESFDALRYYSRSSILYGDNLHANIIFDRDSYEPRALDMFSGNITLRLCDGQSRILIGDFRPGFAQGLVFSRYSRFFLSGCNTQRKDSSRIASTSFEEMLFLRGIYYQFNDERCTVSMWGSHRRLDATLDENNRVLNIRNTGIHASDDSRDNLTETLYGLRSVFFLSTNALAGFTVSHSHYSPSHAETNDERRIQNPIESNFLHLSFDGSLQTEAGKMFFEHARLADKGNATTAGLSLNSEHLSTSILARYYDSDYYARHAAPFSTFSASSNEEGIYWSTVLSLDDRTDIETRFDIGNTLTRRYYSDMPEKRRRVTAILHRDLSSCLKTRLVFRDTHDATDNTYRRSCLGYVNINPASSVFSKIHMALAISQSNGDGGPYAEFGTRACFGNMTINTQINAYDIETYESRLYRYSPDLPGRGSTIPYWGRGHGMTMVIKWNCVSLRYISFNSDKRTPYRRFSLQIDTEF